MLEVIHEAKVGEGHGVLHEEVESLGHHFRLRLVACFREFAQDVDAAVGAFPRLWGPGESVVHAATSPFELGCQRATRVHLSVLMVHVVHVLGLCNSELGLVLEPRIGLRLSFLLFRLEDVCI